MDIEEANDPSSFWRAVFWLSTVTGRSVFKLVWEILTLRFGPGRLSLNEYLELRLFDKDLYGNSDPSRFVGFLASKKIWLLANFRVDLFGLVNNKVASDILFSAHGFPVLPTFAMFREGVGMGGPYLIGNEDDLRAFLRTEENYPFFGKPISGHQSLGSASVDHFDAVNNHLILTTGHRLALDDYVSYVKKYGASGYLFQARISPHAAIREICGNRLATVRLLTVVAKGQPKLLRACWKIPAGINAADNFWRPGNLLAQLDMQTGRVLRVIRGKDVGFDVVTHHPDSGAPITGTVVPNWAEVVNLALEAAKVVEDMPMAGWDVVPVDNGAMLVELSETPDFRLNQLADLRGIMDDDLAAFLAERKTDRKVWMQKVKDHRKGQ